MKSKIVLVLWLFILRSANPVTVYILRKTELPHQTGLAYFRLLV